ncbi:MAG: apolipoprotein N-acyltransferase [Micrococcales bacterium]
MNRFVHFKQVALNLALAAAGGLGSSLAYPNNGIWIAIFPAVALILVAITRSSPRASLLVGFTAGLTWYASQIPWMTAYLGPVPWLALSVLEASIFMIGAYAINLAHLYFKRHSHTMWSTMWLALSVSSLWTARELLASNWPYGGFPWSSVAMSQSDSPFAGIAYWGGQTSITFALVFVTSLVTFGFKELNPMHWHGSLTTVLITSVIALPALTPLETNSQVGTLSVAAIQGNANAGLFANEELGTILQNHLDASQPILNQNTKPDVIIWPENAADLNPLANFDAQWKVTRFVDSVRTPLIFGTITNRGGQYFNSSVLWKPRIGPVDYYDKKRPVPFAEYVPDRQFWALLDPEQIALIGKGYSFGTRDGIFNLKQGKIGVMICFEVAVPEISRELVQAGAKLLVVQTNNSDFGHTNESAQQLAIAKLRAIETGRAVVNISTVGISALIYPNGAVVNQAKAFTPAVLKASLPLRSSLTPAVLFSESFETALASSAFAQVLFLVWLRFRFRKSSRHG